MNCMYGCNKFYLCMDIRYPEELIPMSQRELDFAKNNLKVLWSYLFVIGEI